MEAPIRLNLSLDLAVFGSHNGIWVGSCQLDIRARCNFLQTLHLVCTRKLSKVALEFGSGPVNIFLDSNNTCVCRMDPKLKSIISHLAKLRKAMAEREQKLEEAYTIKFQGDVGHANLLRLTLRLGKKAKKPKPMADVEPKRSWYDCYRALAQRLKTSWQKSGIYNVMSLCTSRSFPCDHYSSSQAYAFGHTPPTA
ncbi:unnamed protein product [Prunus brigantina]